MSQELKEFLVCAEVRSVVYTPIYAYSLEDAVSRVKSDAFNEGEEDWGGEEWTDTPNPLYVYDPKAMKKLDCE